MELELFLDPSAAVLKYFGIRRNSLNRSVVGIVFDVIQSEYVAEYIPVSFKREDGECYPFSVAASV